MDSHDVGVVIHGVSGVTYHSVQICENSVVACPAEREEVDLERLAKTIGHRQTVSTIESPD